MLHRSRIWRDLAAVTQDNTDDAMCAYAANLARQDRQAHADGGVLVVANVIAPPASESSLAPGGSGVSGGGGPRAAAGRSHAEGGVRTEERALRGASPALLLLCAAECYIHPSPPPWRQILSARPGAVG